MQLPYRGLESFRAIDEEYFYGREAEKAILLEIVQQWPPRPPRPFVALIGSSGSGKSSLVHAGVIPALRRDSRWQIAVFRPKRDPFRDFASACMPLLYSWPMDTVESLIQHKKLMDELSTHRLSVVDVVTRLEQVSPSQRLLLVIDQFEELFPTPDPSDQQRLFLEELTALIEGEYHCTVLIMLRSDFLGQVTAFAPWAAAFNNYPPQYLSSMSCQGLRAAIEKPAQELGVEPEEGLTDRIIEDLGQGDGRLPLLQFMLAALWTRRSQAHLTHTAYQAIGGVNKALTSYADEVLAGFPAEQQEQLRRIFIQLVHPGEGTEDTRQVATRAQVSEDNWPLVQQLTRARLLVTAQNEQGQDTVEVVHEALIRHWKKLQEWMEHAREFRVWQTRLHQDMQEWKRGNHNENLLLMPGKRLVDAQAMFAHHEQDLSMEEKAYIRASIAYREQERRTRESIQQQSAANKLLGLVCFWAGMMGAVSRIGASLVFGTLVDPPHWEFTVANIMRPAAHGVMGTVIGSFFVILMLAAWPHDAASLPLRRIIRLFVVGLLWGGIIWALVVNSDEKNLEVITWNAHGQVGFLITGGCWGLGLAIGMYIGNRRGRTNPDIAHLWWQRVKGGSYGTVGCLLLAPLIIAYWFPKARNGRTILWAMWASVFPAPLGENDILRRMWGECITESCCVVAALLCFYWQQRRRNAF